MTPTPADFDLSDARVAFVPNGGAGKKDACAREDAICERLASRVADFRPYPISKGSGIPVAARRAVQDGADPGVTLGGDVWL